MWFPTTKTRRRVARLTGSIALPLALIALIQLVIISPIGVRAQGGFALDAKTLNTLGQIVNSVGLATWPQFASDPQTCASNTEATYYFNTGTKAFRTCDGTSWQDGGGGASVLNDLTDVTLSSPTNNQALIFNSGSGDWENAAQGAAAINDHSDAAVSAPSDGDILLYDGVTDNRWENVAGAAPTTLAGLSDTTLTAPAEGDYLIRNGTDWKNVNPSGSYHIFPYNAVMTEATVVEDFIVTTANDVRVYRDIWENGCVVDRIVWANATVSGCAGAQGNVGLFTLDGNTLLVEAGAQVYDTIDEVHNVDVTNTYIEMGSYWLAYTSASISPSCDVIAFDDPTPTTGPGVDTILNTGNTLIGTGQFQSTAGVFTATLGTISANNTNVNRPLIKFVCTDP